MGRKRNRARKYFYISIACLVVMFLAGCVTLTELKTKWSARESLVAAQKLLDHGDYEGALKENHKVLAAHGHVPPGDESLFNLGLIYAHSGYARRDYEKSLDYFKRLVRLFPQSPHAGQAKIWIGILQKHEKLSAENERLSRENERFNKEVEDLKMTIKKSKQVDIEIDVKKKELSK